MNSMQKTLEDQIFNECLNLEKHLTLSLESLKRAHKRLKMNRQKFIEAEATVADDELTITYIMTRMELIEMRKKELEKQFLSLEEVKLALI